MQILNSCWHDYLVLFSCAACVTGLLLLSDSKQMQADDWEETEQTLFKMSFAYWLVYCVSFGVQKLALPDWEILLLSLKLTTTLSYFLTFACVLCLPMHRFSVRQIED